MKHRICTACGFVGKPVNQCLESFVLDMFIWLVTASLVFMTGLLPLFALSAAWTVFHVLKFRNSKCPKCESLDMVSMNSAKGKAQLAHHQS